MVLDTVKYLIQAGANVDSYDKFGRNPLHYAAINNHSDIADFLRVQKDSVNSAHEQSQVSMRKRLRVSELQDCTSPCSVEYQHISSKRRRLETPLSSHGAVNLSLDTKGSLIELKNKLDRYVPGHSSDHRIPMSSLNSTAVEPMSNKSLQGR
ncbi:MAG: ankyrin repeat domain-containing protein [Wolbachia sp.]